MEKSHEAISDVRNSKKNKKVSDVVIQIDRYILTRQSDLIVEYKRQKDDLPDLRWGGAREPQGEKK